MDNTEKSAEAFRTISEVAEALDVPQHVLRFWEGKFSQIKPMKRGGNRRYYRPEDLDLLRTIAHLLYTDGYTIKGVQKLLRENGARATVNNFIAEHGGPSANGAASSDQEEDAEADEFVTAEVEEEVLDLQMPPQPEASIVEVSAPLASLDEAPEESSGLDVSQLVAELEDIHSLLTQTPQ